MQLEAWQHALAAALTGERADLQSPWPTAALRVHRGNMRGARHQALANVYPVLRQIVGLRCFTSLAREFDGLASNLNFYGRDFSAWLKAKLKRHEELAALPYLPDLARLEWLLHAAYYASDVPVPEMDSFRLAMDSPANWRLRFSPSLSLLASPWPVVTIWCSHREGEPAAELPLQDCYAVVWRQGARPRVLNLDIGTWRLLRAAHSGADLDALAAQGMSAATISLFLQRGWLIGAQQCRGDGG